MEGFLTKKGHFYKNWKVRWFSMKGDEILYYQDQTTSTLKGTFPLSADSFVEDGVNSGQYTSIFVVRTGSKSLTISAGTLELRESWKVAIDAEVRRLRDKRDHEEALRKKETAYVRSLTDHTVRPEPRSEKSRTFRVPEDGGEKDMEQSKQKEDTSAKTSKSKRLSMNMSNITLNAKDNSQINDHTRVGLVSPPAVAKKAEPALSLSPHSHPGTSSEVHTGISDSSNSSNAISERRVSRSTPADIGGTRSEDVSVTTSATSSTQQSSSGISSVSGSGSGKGNETQTVFSISSSSGSGEDVSPKDDDLGDGWMEARTEDGQVYYYHKDTRVTRWDKPEKHIVAALESRLKESKESTEKAIRDRKIASMKEKELLQEKERIIEENKAVIAESLRRWSANHRGEALSFVDLLRTLPMVVPADLLEIIYQGESSRALFDSLLTLTPAAPPVEVKRAYLKAIRFIHPDKLPVDLAIESKALLEGVFIVLQERYDLYRRANDIS